MSDDLCKDLDSFISLRELRGYLKTEKEVGELTANEHNQSVIPLKIKISNTAPNDLQKPLVVFTGVGLQLIPLGHNTSEPMWAHTGGTRQRYELEYQPVECAWFSIKARSVGTVSFPKVTQDESSQGQVLFPGESLTYKFLVPINDRERYGFQVLGNVSRRHLFHLVMDIEMGELFGGDLKKCKGELLASAIKKPEKPPSRQGEVGDVDDYHEDGGRSPNDDRSDFMNPNNDSYQASVDNRSDQMNPNNDAYWSSRGR